MIQRLIKRFNKPTLDSIDQLCDILHTIYQTEADRKKRQMVAIEFSQELVNACKDWTPPVNIKFFQHPNGQWDMQVRVHHDQTAAVEALRAEVAARAARQ